MKPSGQRQKDGGSGLERGQTVMRVCVLNQAGILKDAFTIFLINFHRKMCKLSLNDTD